MPDPVSSPGGGRSSVEAWKTTAVDIEEVFSGVVKGELRVFFFVADVVGSFDTVDRGGRDRVLRWLVLLARFWHA